MATAEDLRGESPPRRASGLGWAGAALACTLVLNPWTIEVWWLRRHYLPASATKVIWAIDAVVLAAGVLLAQRRRRSQNARPPGPPVPRRAELLALALGTMLAALSLEGLLRLNPKLAMPASIRRELRWRARHGDSLQYQPTARRVDDFSPFLGWQLRPNLRDELLTSNTAGIRATREYTAEPAPGVHRVVCVGDSFTFGENLRDEDAMPARTEVALDRDAPGRWEFLNLAVHGYGIDQQWLRLQTLGFGYHPEIVVLGFFEEDLERNALSFRDYAKPYFEVVDGRLVLRNVPVPAPDDILARPIPWPRSYVVSLFGWLPGELERELAPFGALRDTRVGRVTLAILDAVHEGVAAHGARLVLMIIPRPIPRRGSDTEQMLERWANDAGVPVLTLRREYLKLPEAERRTLYRGHWTPHGAEVTARLLAVKLRAVVDGGARSTP